MDDKELLARVDESTKSAHKRIDRLEETIKDIRELTFGPVYKQPIKCPHCGMSQEADINIADFEYNNYLQNSQL